MYNWITLLYTWNEHNTVNQFIFQYKIKMKKIKIFSMTILIITDFLSDSVVQNPPAKHKIWVWSLVWEDPLGKEMATHSSILA